MMKTGFTLIELLVVVLIIGILSAVALPQYTKAVAKARASEGLTNMTSVERACNMWHLSSPGVAGNGEDVFGAGGVEMPTSKNFAFGVSYKADGTCTGGARYPADATPEGAEVAMIYKRVGNAAPTRRCCMGTSDAKAIGMCDAAKNSGYTVTDIGACTADLYF